MHLCAFLNWSCPHTSSGLCTSIPSILKQSTLGLVLGLRLRLCVRGSLGLRLRLCVKGFIGSETETMCERFIGSETETICERFIGSETVTMCERFILTISQCIALFVSSV